MDADSSSREKRPSNPSVDVSLENERSPVPIESVRPQCRFRTAAMYWPSQAHDLDIYQQTQSLGPDVTVVDGSGQCLVSVPLDFLCNGGVAKAEALRQMVGFCFKEDGRLQRLNGETALVEDDISLQPDTYVFVRSDGSKNRCEPCEGPHFRFPYGLFMNEFQADVIDAEENTDDETMISLHREIHGRYKSRCLFSGLISPDNSAFAIVPPPVADAVKEKVREEWDPVFTESFRFPHELLEQTSNDIASSWLVFGVIEQTMWERGQLALWPYPRSKGYIVHTFKRSPLHGKVIPRSHLKIVNEGLFQRLLEFHYSQCAMKMLRGSSAGPAPCDDEVLGMAYDDGANSILNLDELLEYYGQAPAA